MASSVNMSDSTHLPQIIELIISNKLPAHPKIRFFPSLRHLCTIWLNQNIENGICRYTSTLILGRYAQWTKNNPSTIPTQLQFIISGFSDPEVAPASALALNVSS